MTPVDHRLPKAGFTFDVPTRLLGVAGLQAVVLKHKEGRLVPDQGRRFAPDGAVLPPPAYSSIQVKLADCLDVTEGLVEDLKQLQTLL